MQVYVEAKVDFLIYFLLRLNGIWLINPVIIELMDNFFFFFFFFFFPTSPIQSPTLIFLFQMHSTWYYKYFELINQSGQKELTT